MKLLIKLCILNRKAVSLLNRLHLRLLAKAVAFPRQKYCLEFLKKQIQKTLSVKYDYDSLVEVPADERKVFVMWLQGEREMPFIVQKCYESIKTAFKNIGKVELITEANIPSFLELPDFILEKYKKGFISHTTFSDIVRTGLLTKYGGVWIDSTVFLTSEIPFDYIDKPYFCLANAGDTVRTEWKYLYGTSRGWSGWFCGSKFLRFPLFDFIYNAFLEYFSTCDYIIDYFQIDFFTALFYRNDQVFKSIVDSFEGNDIYVYELMNLLKKVASQRNKQRYEFLKRSGFINKLSYKIDYKNHTRTGRQTMYDWVFIGEK